MIHILTDSTADLSKSQCDNLQIETIPMYVQLNGNIYKDGEDIDAQTLFTHVEKTGKYPTTSAPSPGDFIKFFDRKGEAIYIGVSSMLSTTFRNAQLALRELGGRKIDIIDSLSISTGYGQVVLKAARWRNAGMGFQELGHRIRQSIKQTRGIFILDTLDYLFHGGRCSALNHLVASILRIRPFLNIRQDGMLGVIHKVRGSRKKAVNALFDYFKSQLESFDIKDIIITHLDCCDEATYLKKKFQELDTEIEISQAKVGCVLATHSGPKPLGIAYSVKKLIA